MTRPEISVTRPEISVIGFFNKAVHADDVGLDDPGNEPDKSGDASYFVLTNEGSGSV